jgi:hypothetical protein
MAPTIEKALYPGGRGIGGVEPLREGKSSPRRQPDRAFGIVSYAPIAIGAWRQARRRSLDRAASPLSPWETITTVGTSPSPTPTASRSDAAIDAQSLAHAGVELRIAAFDAIRRKISYSGAIGSAIVRWRQGFVRRRASRPQNRFGDGDVCESTGSLSWVGSSKRKPRSPGRLWPACGAG